MSNNNKKWIENRKAMLKLLENMKVTRTTDRLEILRNWITAHNIVNESLVGWAQWLNSIALMESIDRKTLKEMFEKYRDFAIQFVEFDIEATQKIDKQINKKKVKKKSKTGVEIARQYVA